MTSFVHAVAKFADFLTGKPFLPPPIATGRSIRVDKHDPDEMLQDASEASEIVIPEEELGWAEGQTFAICYEDCSGNATERRITVRSIRLNPENIPLLVAWCYERQALRTFRLDRVIAVIDRDGEVISPAAPFFVETFGMSPRLATCTAPKPASLVRIRKSFTHHLMMLAHLAAVDGYSDLDEQAVIIDHCLRLAKNEDLSATSAEEESLRRYVKGLKPTKYTIEVALMGLQRDTPNRVVALVTAAHHVMDADGFRDPAEERFLSELKRDLTGL
jgi:hypothetical protein